MNIAGRNGDWPYVAEAWAGLAEEAQVPYETVCYQAGHTTLKIPKNTLLKHSGADRSPKLAPIIQDDIIPK